VLNNTNETAPPEAAGLETSDTVRDIELAGDYAYIADYDIGLLIFRTSSQSTWEINGDNIVNYKDLGPLGASYGLSPGDTGYSANADLNEDGIVNYKDLGILGARYGEQT